MLANLFNKQIVCSDVTLLLFVERHYVHVVTVEDTSHNQFNHCTFDFHDSDRTLRSETNVTINFTLGSYY